MPRCRLQEAARCNAAEKTTGDRPYQLLTMSAKTPSALDRISQNHTNYLEREHLNSKSKMSPCARFRQSQRIPCSAASLCRHTRPRGPALLRGAAFRPALYRTSCGKGSERVFLFSGQAQQYLNMGRALYESEPIFRAQLDLCAEQLTEPLSGSPHAALSSARTFRRCRGKTLSYTLHAACALTIEYPLPNGGSHLEFLLLR